MKKYIFIVLIFFFTIKSQSQELYQDNDCDGYPSAQYYSYGCYADYYGNNLDCDDNDPNVTIPMFFYADNDGDGYGNPSNPTQELLCTPPTGFVANNLDCDDNNANSNVGNWYRDQDNDGFGDSSYSITNGECSPPIGYAANNTDCNDADASINPNTKWYLDANGDGVITDLDGATILTQCSQPVGNYFTLTDTKFHWIHGVSYDLKGIPTSSSRTYFDDLGKSDLSLSKDFVQNKIWGTEVTYDSFGRPDKSSFVAPSSLSNFGKVGFLSTGTNYPSANANLTNYYSDNNSQEPYQATAAQPYSQTNYDLLNPGNVINVVGGNQIAGQWKTGYSHTVPAAQEMYYVYGSDYYDGDIVAGKEEVITKFYKSVGVDANGVENVAFSDGEGKVLATARSGGASSYPVVSLIGTQGFVDVHIPAGITSGIALIGGASLYKVYDLKTGLLTSATLVGGNAYRIEAITPPTTDPKTYIAGGVPTYDAGALGITYSVNYYDYSVNIYNKTGQLLKSVQPMGYESNSTVKAVPAHMAAAATAFISTYIYNVLGQVIQASSPDEGTSKFAYRKDGQIRYSQSALQALSNKISYTNYDSYGRPIESGVITGTSTIWASALAGVDDVAALVAGTQSEMTFSVYDYTANTVTSSQIPTAYSLTIPSALSLTTLMPSYIQNNLSGNIAVTYKADLSTTITAITWYSYDIYGRSEWMVQYNEGLGAKTIHYEYDYKGNVKRVIYQKDKSTELFAHRYSYDANDVLQQVETATNIVTPNYIVHANYSYYQTGELKRVNIAQGAQGIDYVYTLGGALKSINHPSLDITKDPGGDANDVFGITLDYYNGDYLRTGKNITTSTNVTGSNQDFNGNIKAARWANKSSSMDLSGTTVNQKGYLYNYNRNNWLTGATYGTTDGTTAAISPTANYTESGLTYDANGNIKTLQRSNN